jgi:hypothetical protein
MAPRPVQRGAGGFPARHISSSPTCNALSPGTVVLTLDGALPVEYLVPGDRVITRDSGCAVLKTHVFRRARLPGVLIQGGALGHMRPDQEVLLPASQEILLRDWRAKALFGAAQALVPVSRLVDGSFVCALGEIEMGLHELVFDRPHILYVDGLELASARQDSVVA